MKPTAEETESKRTAKLEAAKAMLATAVAALQTSEGWMRMLKAMASAGRFGLRRLSFRNQLLVICQHPTATAVATFKAWIREGRVVQKGQHAITILAPVIVKRADDADPSKEPTSKLIGFRPHNVFAKDQTAPLPGKETVSEPTEPTIQDFCKDVEDDGSFGQTVETLRSFAVANLSESVSSIELRPRQGGDHSEAHGWYEPTTKRIVVITGETSRAMQVKTLCHELGHALLHPIESRNHSRDEGEVEAESVAFLVCNMLGIDSASYSVGYVANWGKDKDAERMILASGQRIVGAANKILDAFETSGTGAEDPELMAA